MEFSVAAATVQKHGQEELPHVQGQERRCFDGAAMKSYHTSKVRETQLRGRH